METTKPRSSKSKKNEQNKITINYDQIQREDTVGVLSQQQQPQQEKAQLTEGSVIH